MQIAKGTILRIRVTEHALPGCKRHVDLVHEGKLVRFSTYADGRTTKEAVDRAVQQLRRKHWFPVLKKHGVKFKLVGSNLTGKNIRKVF